MEERCLPGAETTAISALIKRHSRGFGGWMGRGMEDVCMCVSLSLSRGDMSRKETRGGPHRGDKLRQHPRTRLLLRFWNASPSLPPPPPRHSRAIPFSGYGAMCCWRDDIREIERRVKYLWPNQMRGRGASPDKSREILTPNDCSLLARFSPPYCGLLPLRLPSFIVRSKCMESLWKS